MIQNIQPSVATLEQDAIHTLFVMGPEDGLILVSALDQKFETLYRTYLPLALRAGGGD